MKYNDLKQIAVYIFDSMPDINSILSFDLETCGVLHSDRIVSFSAIRIEKDSEVIEAIDLAINPGVPIPKEASDVHGITDKMVLFNPDFAFESNTIFDLFCKTDLVIGYNIEQFDIPSLKFSFSEIDPNHDFLSLQIKYMDMMSIFKAMERRDLASAVKFYTGESIEGHHESLSDSISSLKVFSGQIKKYGIESLLEFVKTGDDAILERHFKKDDLGQYVFNFGKHKGELVSPDKKSYMQWIIDKSDMVPMVKQFCKKQLTGMP